tara:strand:+ start:88 stop:510 length:423 start_codon:yes stop_codon:yes gene_type:complete
MNNCHNISGVTYITLSGTENLSSGKIYYDILENGGNTYRNTWDLDSAEVKFDTPVDIYNVYSYLQTKGKKASVVIKFYTAGNVLIRSLYHNVKKKTGSYWVYEWYQDPNYGTKKRKKYTYYDLTERSRKESRKPMLEQLA